ncbi:hypothetical protein LEMLEM_LOCUS4715, partial [Lemmus lemmus]
MEADAEMHSQALGPALGILLKKTRRDYKTEGARSRQGTH